MKLSDNGSVYSISPENLYTEDYEQVKKADLIKDASLNAFIDNEMCPCNLIKGTYSLFCVQLLGADSE